MPIDPASHVPIYEQIIAHVRGLIAAGVVRPDEMLPSVRTLATELVVNPNTVQRAYQELERMKLVRSRKGVGMFVAPNGAQAAVEHAADGVYATFKHGVAAGRAADMPRKRIRTVFEKALEDHKETRP